jgi:mono/diheme cytochrome c family protein
MRVRSAWRLVGGAVVLAVSGVHVGEAGAEKSTGVTPPLAVFSGGDFTDNYCANCHDSDRKKGGLDLTALSFTPGDPANFAQWVKVHDRLLAHEMPPKKEDQPSPSELQAFVSRLTGALTAAEQASYASEGRATQRRLNSYEYENALRDVLFAPWLEIRGELPEDGEKANFNKIGDALDVSHVQMARYLAAADGALREVMSTQFQWRPSTVHRYYARDQRTLTGKFIGDVFNTSPDRMTYPVVGLNTAQPDVRWRRVPLTDPATRDEEAVAWVSSNYVTGFSYRWDQFRAPVAGRYRIKFSGYTLWVPPGGIERAYKNERDHTGTERKRSPYLGDYDNPQPGRRDEPITVYTRNGLMNRRVGAFDLTPEPAVHDVGEVWLLANETLVPDASRFFRSRPTNYRNPLMQKDGAPSVAFRWMEVEGPLSDASTGAGYRLLFGDLPMKQLPPGSHGVILPVVAPSLRRGLGRKDGERVEAMSEVTVEVISANPDADAERLLRGFMARAYRRPVEERDVQRFLGLYHNQRDAGLGFAQSLLASYTAVLSSPSFLFLNEQPGELDDYALATRLSLFLWNSVPDDELRACAARGELHRSDVLRAQTDRMLADPKSERFIEAFLDYWLDLRKMDDSTPSTSLYNDYYLDDALEEASLDETRLYFADMLYRNQPARAIVASDYTFLNERLAQHYGVPGVQGVAMRRVSLPPDSPRGGIITQASILKVTANGTNTSPVIRGKWVMERILGFDVPPPPPVVPAVEPDIRGAVTLRQQLAKHHTDPNCASCHAKIDPPGFALENFDVMGGWRDRYRALDETKTPIKGIGKNGHPFEFFYGLPVDASGEFADGRKFTGIRDFRQLLLADETTLARNMAKQLVIYATGAPIHFSDRPALEQILAWSRASDYGIKTLVEEVVQSDLFRSK